ncbi:hypothetical protein [Xinfangfangia pollutisoli]|uniref:hypothetical protein n=1 Tax=Xinfangfangia pollutisoli TaxID=2865960 RepID=UPI001CD437D4|nr:hypothetical protein [Xinfangfangia pollutisoli]
MTAPRSANTGNWSAPADFPGRLAAGAFGLARQTGRCGVGTGAALFVIAAAHATLVPLFLGESLIRRVTG